VKTEGRAEPTVIRVGATGHRKLGDDPRVPLLVHAECVRVLELLHDLAEFQDANLIAYSLLAIGADSLFAEAAVGLGIPLVGVIPFADYPNDFEGDERRQFDTLLSLCREVHHLPGKHRSDRAYLRGGQWVVDHVDHVVAVWDGLPAKGLGGTADVVAYAHKKKKPVYRIDPTTLEKDDA
jgi:hypothetical protein